MGVNIGMRGWLMSQEGKDDIYLKDHYHNQHKVKKHVFVATKYFPLFAN